MEESLTMEELELLLESDAKKENRMMKFMAALKGIDLDEGKQDDTFERIRLEAEAHLSNQSAQNIKEQEVFDLIGIDVEKEEDVN